MPFRAAIDRIAASDLFVFIAINRVGVFAAASLSTSRIADGVHGFPSFFWVFAIGIFFWVADSRSGLRSTQISDERAPQTFQCTFFNPRKARYLIH
jgi:hypothetical protein